MKREAAPALIQPGAPSAVQFASAAILTQVTGTLTASPRGSGRLDRQNVNVIPRPPAPAPTFDLEAFLESAQLYYDATDATTITGNLDAIASNGVLDYDADRTYQSITVNTYGGKDYVLGVGGSCVLEVRDASNNTKKWLDCLPTDKFTMLAVLYWTYATTGRFIDIQAGGFTRMWRGGTDPDNNFTVDLGTSPKTSLANNTSIGTAEPFVVVVRMDATEGKLFIGVNGGAEQSVALNSVTIGNANFLLMNASPGWAFSKLAFFNEENPTDLASAVAALKTEYGIT